MDGNREDVPAVADVPRAADKIIQENNGSIAVGKSNSVRDIVIGKPQPPLVFKAGEWGEGNIFSRAVEPRKPAASVSDIVIGKPQPPRVFKAGEWGEGNIFSRAVEKRNQNEQGCEGLHRWFKEDWEKHKARKR